MFCLELFSQSWVSLYQGTRLCDKLVTSVVYLFFLFLHLTSSCEYFQNGVKFFLSVPRKHFSLKSSPKFQSFSAKSKFFFLNYCVDRESAPINHALLPLCPWVSSKSYIDRYCTLMLYHQTRQTEGLEEDLNQKLMRQFFFSKHGS